MKKKNVLMGLFIFAILFQVGYMLVYESPFDLNKGSDSEQYDHLALNIISGKGYVLDRRPEMILENVPYSEIHEKPTAWRVPGYPLFLTAIYKICGYSHIKLFLIQIFFCIWMFYMLYRISFFLFGKTASYFLLAILAIWPVYACFSTQVMSEIFGCFLFTSVIYLLIFKEKLKWFAFAGGLFGLSILTRTPFLLCFPFLFLFAFYKKPRFAMVFLLCIILVFVPWIVRNNNTFDAFIPLSTQSGEGLYWSTLPFNKEWGSVGGLNPDLYPIYFNLVSTSVGTLTSSEIFQSETLKSMAIDNIRDHPFQILKYRLENIWIAWKYPYKMNMFDTELFDDFASKIKIGFLIKRNSIGYWIFKIGYMFLWWMIWLYGFIFIWQHKKEKKYWLIFILALFPLLSGCVLPIIDRLFIPFFPFILMPACAILANFINMKPLKPKELETITDLKPTI